MDPTRPGALPDQNVLVRNLAALWAIEPTLAEQIDALDHLPSYKTEPTRAGPPTVVVPGASGRPVYLHSKYQPIDEAQKLLKDVDFTSRHFFYLYGLGMGYVLEQLYSSAGKDAIICVFEPDLLLIRTAMEHRDFSTMIESGRLWIYHTPDKAALYQKLTPNSAMVSLGTQSIVHGPSMQLHPEFHTQMQTWVDEFSSFARTQLNTLVINGKITAENITRNLRKYIDTPSPADIHNKYRGKPALIVSAGPSLRKNRHLLRKMKDHAVIIAVQTTLQPLLEMGIEPDFVTSLDYHDICARFYEKLPATLNTRLVAEPKATPLVFKLFPGPVTVIGNDFAESMLREMNIAKMRMGTGATVAHLAFYTAELLGCDPIVFVGQDLGFSDGLCYTPGTSYEDVWRPELSRFCTVEMKQWEQIVRDRFILRKVPDIHGRPMYTEERLFSYLQQFERDFLKSQSTIIDATEGGAAKRGTMVMKLADVIERYCNSDGGTGIPACVDSCEKDTGKNACATDSRYQQAQQCLHKRREEAKLIEQIGSDTLPLLEEIRDHLEDQPRVNRAIGRIDTLRARMNGVGKTYDLVTQWTQSTEMKRFESDRRIAASQLSPLEKQRQQVQRDIINVRGVTEAAIEFQKTLDDVIADFKDHLPNGGTGSLACVQPRKNERLP